MNRGFTFIEIILVVSIIGIVATISIPLMRSFQVRNDIDVTVNTIAQSLRRAQILAQASDGDSMWGLKLQPQSIVIFKGSAYASRDDQFDELFSVSVNVSFLGLTEIVFQKVSGEPIAAGTITLTNADNDGTRTVAVNSKGFVDY